MKADIIHQQAMILCDRGLRHQSKGELGDAIVLYKRSLAVKPTAEAYTYLGWTYNLLQRTEEAIECCEKAIETDPTLGNPYNDIGAYLINLGRLDEALPWLESALKAPRYESPQFAHFNLGRAYELQGKQRRALNCYDEALKIDPLYRTAAWAKYELLASLN